MKYKKDNNNKSCIEESTFEILKTFDQNRNELIPILQTIQKTFGYLPEKSMEIICEFLTIPESVVYGVATFYPYFKLVPTGKNVVKVCRGTACHIRGGSRVLKETEKQLGVEPGHSTDDLEYFLETVACIGACALSPAITINDQTYGQMTPNKIIETFHKIKGDK